ncbi:SCG5 family protein [Megaselia abdita]
MKSSFFVIAMIIFQPYAGYCFFPFALEEGMSPVKVPDYIPDIFIKDLIDRMSEDYSEVFTGPLIEPSRLTRFDINPHPSIRDQEYLQHSNLWGHQYVSGGGGELPSNNKHEVKSDAGLPAYCNPPNPCPVGFTSDDGCIEGMENTAAFSREFQGSQDCMCDAEHMFECSKVEDVEDDDGVDLESFLAGEKLPIAAKKGFNIH